MGRRPENESGAEHPNGTLCPAVMLPCNLTLYSYVGKNKARAQLNVIYFGFYSFHALVVDVFDRQVKTSLMRVLASSLHHDGRSHVGAKAASQPTSQDAVASRDEQLDRPCQEDKYRYVSLHK